MQNERDFFIFLEKLQKSGMTNPVAFCASLQVEFGITNSESSSIFCEWAAFVTNSTCESCE